MTSLNLSEIQELSVCCGIVCETLQAAGMLDELPEARRARELSGIMQRDAEVDAAVTNTPDAMRFGNLAACWDELGEQEDEEDEDSPTMLRLDVFTCIEEDGEDEGYMDGWYLLRNGSFCTNVVDTATPQQRRTLLRRILVDLARDAANHGQTKPTKDRLGMMSWVDVEGNGVKWLP